MSKIRVIEIKNFRGIKSLIWFPKDGINCLIGPGDSCKSSILEAIELCVNGKRSGNFTDADFHSLNVLEPITIKITLGALDPELLDLDTYSHFLRGFDPVTKTLSDEPTAEGEDVLTISLTVEADLEPVWALFSERAASQGFSLNLKWSDRNRLAATRIGSGADHNLAWRRGSVLNRLSDEQVSAGSALTAAVRDARNSFGDQAAAHLESTLTLVHTRATQLGIPVGASVRALLDMDSLSFGGGTISLHSDVGIPLSRLGLGSSRLLIAGLQHAAADTAGPLIIDELESGLEPHRIIRLLHSLGSKDTTPKLQVFASTHSPAALRELSTKQITLVRKSASDHLMKSLDDQNLVQGTLRACPEAFLAPSVLVCEGATEVGFVRGLSQYYSENGESAIEALGVALVDAASVSKIYQRALPFHSLGYRVAILRDDDTPPNAADESTFIESGGNPFIWRNGRALEDELFISLETDPIWEMVCIAKEIHGEVKINEHIKSASNNTFTLEDCDSHANLIGELTPEQRAFLATSAKNSGWFKNVSTMERIAREVVGPNLSTADAEFVALIQNLFTWIRRGHA